MEFFTDNSSGTKTKVLTLDKSQNATFASDLTVTGQGFITGGAAGETALQLTGQYSGSGTVHILEFQRVGGAVKGDLSYTDATTDMEFGTATSHAFSIKTADTRRLTIASGGDATFSGSVTASSGTGTFGALISTGASTWALTCNPTANNYGGILFQYGGVTKGACYYNSGLMIFGGESGIPTRLQAGGGYGLHMDATNQNVHIGSTNDATYKFQVTGTVWFSSTLNVVGNITSDADVIAYSDKKLKKNIKTLDGSKVYDMRGVSFNRIDLADKKSSGVIAQEIEKIAPELIHEAEDGTLGVAYGNLTGYLIEAIKDLKAEIEELKKCNKCENCNCENK